MPGRPHPRVTLVCLLLAGSAQATTGYRGDGSGRFDSRSSPSLDKTAAQWKTPLESWSNAGVVLFGDMACTTAEPTEVVCVDQGTGAVRWRASNDYLTTLDPKDSGELAERIRAADAAADRLVALQRAYSAARREVRRDASKAAEVERLAGELAEAKKIIDATAEYRTPSNKEVIGYASATPVTDGKQLYAAFGNGVVSAFDLTGERQWSVWMGTPPPEMRGYHMGVTSSPVLADGKLIVSNGTLAALDPATGTTLWSKGPYDSYGAPAPVTLEGTAWLATPSGELLRAKDGVVGTTGMGDVWFISPLVVGDRVFYIGGQGSAQLRETGHMAVRAWTLDPKGDTVDKTHLWSNRLDIQDAMYAAPIYDEGRIHMLDSAGHLRTLNATDGQLLSNSRLSGYMPLGQPYAPLVIAGGALFVHGEEGALARLSLGPQPVLESHQVVGSSRASATVDPSGRMYLRTMDAILCLQ